jgi:hypothetical protein
MQIIGDHRSHRRNELGGILIIRVDHDDNVRAGFERQAVAGLLVAAVALVFLVHMHLHTQK